MTQSKVEIVLIGGGGHCRSVIDVIEQTDSLQIVGVVDQKGQAITDVLGYPVLGTDEDLPKLVAHIKHALVTVGQIKTPKVRRELYLRLKSLGFALPTVVSPLATISRHARIGAGTVVLHQCVVNAGATIGENCIINTAATIEHDCKVDDHSHISVRAVLCGGASVGEGCFVGAGALCKEGVTIGNDSVIGMGERVFRPTPPGSFIRNSAEPS